MPTPRELRNVVVLAACQALFQTGSVVIITAGGLAGHLLATDKSLATLPISAWMIGAMLTTLPASMFMGRVGRRPGFWLGAFFGGAGGALAVLGLMQGSFWLFTLAHLLHGAYQGFAQFYRFAAAEGVSPAFRSRAISYVLAGPIVAAIAGPYLVAFSRDLAVTGAFVATYTALILLSLVAAALIALIDVPPPEKETAAEPPRPLPTIARQPAFLVAVAGAAVGYGVMNLAMTATPLAMAAHQHSIHQTALVIQWHVLGMFVPSFFTGSLIARYGAPQIMLVGYALFAAHVTIVLSGNELLHYLSALTLLGIGWNFSFIGGTALLTETYQPAEKAKVQGVNDFLVLSTVVVTSFASGALLHGVGWSGVNIVALPLLGLVAIALILFLFHRRAAASSAAREV